jgi:poly-gamma-glutamate capsule biosynthesis protein CapA/YwtB (metallophosphatase superfamily)
MQNIKGSKQGCLTLASTGDSLITRRLSTNTEEEFLSVIELIRGADVAFTNLETTIHDYRGYPAAQSGGAWMVSPLHIAKELKWAGFNLLSFANNHTMDWSTGGMFATMDILDQAGLTHAGTGENLAEARRPAYMDTDKGRVALISASSTFAPFGRAGHSRREIQGRPGLNPLRYETTYQVNEETFNVLKDMSEKLDLRRRQGTDEPDELSILSVKFKVDERPKTEMKAHGGDLDGNLRSVKDASRQADWVIVSLHTHEREGNITMPASFTVDFARACVEAGADAVVMHGAHVLRGVEIHEGRPIYYGLSNFIYQSRTLERLPEDIYENYGLGVEATPADVFDAIEERYHRSDRPRVEGSAPHLTGSTYSVLALSTFEDRELTELRLYPITLGPERHRIHCGYPRLAKGDLSNKIIDVIAELSSSFGTRVEYREGVGIVDLGK